MKDLWYQFVIDNRKYWCHGFTKKRLEKVKPFVMEDEKIWNDLFLRHDMANMKPEAMKQHRKALFDHAFSNFTSAILHKMIDKNIVKP